MEEEIRFHPDKETVKVDIRKDAQFNFSLFGVFFIFYLGAAILQTPPCKDIATISFWGMPLGLLLSLSVFPVSWGLITIFFWKGR
ncbi:MAG: hypothetical protein A2017_10335 [Lentisphaerae bacterium GWF2_44_16]|nr:MAG: hypothetical protein A2017_10335 [Lentisphaerae bacterium GWF2_44_16]